MKSLFRQYIITLRMSHLGLSIVFSSWQQLMVGLLFPFFVFFFNFFTPNQWIHPILDLSLEQVDGKAL